ncbi:fungal-specific transcription factor domain-containing protein [Xylariaceae sp. AK1471]|nr:fungal-specific transcription factor domain-containing protein [Xylariaceae sp. AK1471]
MSTSIMKTGISCWTCQDRKIKCDRGVPTCQRCARARRECQGYGLRLSWPRNNDRRRAIMGTSPATELHTSQKFRHLFINTNQWDIELYHHLSQRSPSQRPNLVQPSPRLWRQPQSRVKHEELVYHFHDVAYLSLVTFNPITSSIRDVLMHMALAHDTVSGHAILYALLAFSSLHRSGLHQETMQFKVTALQALSASAKRAAQGLVEAAIHVATCMLLCAFEILLPSESSGEWLWYIRGAMDIVQVARLEQQSNQSDIGNLLDWVYYHDALSRFTKYHWRHKSVALEVTDTTSSNLLGVQHSLLAKYRPMSRSPNPRHAILNLLCEMCDILLDPWDPQSQDEGYQGRLKALEWNINNLPTLIPTSTTSTKPSTGIPIAEEVYQIAAQIYLARASQSPWEPSTKLDSLVEKAFAIPYHAPFCNHFFPLFVLACEARTDEQRVAVLGLIDRSEKAARSRSMKGFRAQIRSFWVQQDLHADGELILNYLGLMNAVISSTNALPSFV